MLTSRKGALYAAYVAFYIWESGNMAAKFMIPILMASFLLMGASSTSLWDEKYQNLDLVGNGGRDDDVRAEDDLVITDFKWTADETVSLSVCWNFNLTELRQNVTDIYLNGPSSGDLDDTGYCALFDELSDYSRLPSTTTTYTIDVHFSNGSSMTGSATFAMTVETTILDCAASILTKISWADNTTELLNPNCIEEPEPLELLCYHIGNLSHQEFCFTVPNDADPTGGNLTVCLDGPTDHIANITPDESFSVNYLQYEGADGPSLSLNTAGAAAVDAVIVETDDGGRPTVHRCNSNTCRLPEEFVPSKNHYKLCMDLNITQTATTTFQDLQVTILEAAAQNRAIVEPPYLQFVFANALPNQNYSASLWKNIPNGSDSPLAFEIIECTEVAPDHGCFGVLSTDTQEEVAYLALANPDDGTNQVIVPYNAGIAMKTELTSTKLKKNEH